MKRYLVLFVAALSLVLSVRNAEAKKVYVKDVLEITLRTGPSTENKIIGILRTGEPLEILDTRDEWVMVRPLEMKRRHLEGWVLGRYLMDRVPWDIQAQGLRKENERLSEKVSDLERDSAEMNQREQSIAKELKNHVRRVDELKKEYEALKKDSTKYLELKNAHKDALLSLETLQKRKNELEVENAGLKSSQRIRWFGMGALVLLFGLIIGIVMGRKEKKRKSLYY